MAPCYRKGEKGPHNPGTLGTLFTKERKEDFLEELRATGRRAEAAERVQVSMACVGNHSTPGGNQYDPEFTAGIEEAMLRFKDSLVKEAHRRGVEGVSEPVWYRGVRAHDGVNPDTNEPIPATVQKYSDKMLELLLKRHIPEFRDRVTVDQNTSIKGGLAVGLADLDDLSPAGRAKLRELLDLEAPGEEPE